MKIRGYTLYMLTFSIVNVFERSFLSQSLKFFRKILPIKLNFSLNKNIYCSNIQLRRKSKLRHHNRKGGRNFLIRKHRSHFTLPRKVAFTLILSVNLPLSSPWSSIKNEIWLFNGPSASVAVNVWMIVFTSVSSSMLILQQLSGKIGALSL